jgi:hypothetical protein
VASWIARYRHAVTHALGGADPLTPGAIGAAVAGAAPTAHATSHATGGADPLTPGAIGAAVAGAAPTAHATSHATGGADPLTVERYSGAILALGTGVLSDVNGVGQTLLIAPAPCTLTGLWIYHRGTSVPR